MSASGERIKLLQVLSELVGQRVSILTTTNVTVTGTYKAVDPNKSMFLIENLDTPTGKYPAMVMRFSDIMSLAFDNLDYKFNPAGQVLVDNAPVDSKESTTTASHTTTTTTSEPAVDTQSSVPVKTRIMPEMPEDCLVAGSEETAVVDERNVVVGGSNTTHNNNSNNNLQPQGQPAMVSLDAGVSIVSSPEAHSAPPPTPQLATQTSGSWLDKLVKVKSIANVQPHTGLGSDRLHSSTPPVQADAVDAGETPGQGRTSGSGGDESRKAPVHAYIERFRAWCRERNLLQEEGKDTDGERSGCAVYYYKNARDTTIPGFIGKRFSQRRDMFSLFDEGVMVDGPAWFEVTNEAAAEIHARRCVWAAGPDGVVADLCGGVGGNTIAVARLMNKTKRNRKGVPHKGGRVVYVDNSPLRVACAEHNAKLYGVDDRIDFLEMDVWQSLRTCKADVVVMSPPWGGRGYRKKRDETKARSKQKNAASRKKNGTWRSVQGYPADFEPIMRTIAVGSPPTAGRVFDLREMPIDLMELVPAIFREVTCSLCLIIPDNTDQRQLRELTKLCTPPVADLVYADRMLTVYFGTLALAPDTVREYVEK